MMQTTEQKPVTQEVTKEQVSAGVLAYTIAILAAEYPATWIPPVIRMVFADEAVREFNALAIGTVKFRKSGAQGDPATATENAGKSREELLKSGELASMRMAVSRGVSDLQRRMQEDTPLTQAVRAWVNSEDFEKLCKKFDMLPGYLRKLLSDREQPQ